MLPEILFARQPVFNHRLEVMGYELLFRNSQENHALIEDSQHATINVLANAFMRTDTARLLNNRPGLVNIDLTMADQLPPELHQQVIVEILEDCHSDVQLIDCLKRLKRRGFTIALDDFRLKDFRPELIDLVDIVKVDVLVTPAKEVDVLLMWLRDFDVQLLAEKVEDYAMYHRCKEQGFTLFQGYFFAKPEMISGKRSDTNRSSVMRLLSGLYQPDVELEDIERLLASDAALSFQLVQLVNSALYKRANSIASLHQAITFLGVERIRNWATLIAMSQLGDKPVALQHFALSRALLCESLALETGTCRADRLFTLGLFSVLDAWLDEPMKDLVQQLPLDTALKAALLGSDSREGRLLQLARTITETDWEDEEDGLQFADLPEWRVGELYLDAVIRSDSMLASPASLNG